jgi:hypothetical protein
VLHEISGPTRRAQFDRHAHSRGGVARWRRVAAETGELGPGPVSTATLDRLTSACKLRSIRVSDGRVGWTRKALDAYLAQLE